MVKILVVEDEKPISNLIKISLTKVGYICTCVYDGMSAANCLDEEMFDLVLLDIQLPQVNGYELLDYIRPLEIPVIFITAKSSVEDRVKGLRLGAEDYIVKPFEISELQARIDVVLRRNKKIGSMYKIAGLTVDLQSMRVWRGDSEIHLTKKEYDLLVLFTSNPDTALYRDAIYRRVWGEEMEFGSRTVDLHVQRLRKKVGWKKELQAVNKVGYRLEVKA